MRAELAAGRSVVLIGPYGIGRTALAEQVAREMTASWRFVFADFDRGPGPVWRDLFAAIFPIADARLRGGTKPMKWTRFRVSNRRPEDPRRHVIVLDNVARLSAPRLDVLRRLRESFQVVAIAEDFLPERAKAVLRAALWARAPLWIGPLSRTATVYFLEECSRRHGLGWRAREIQGLARAAHGYPLGMRETVTAALRRRSVLAADGRPLPRGS